MISILLGIYSKYIYIISTTELIVPTSVQKNPPQHSKNCFNRMRKPNKLYLKLESFLMRKFSNTLVALCSDLWLDCQTNFASLWAWQTALVTKRWTAPANKCQAAR